MFGKRTLLLLPLVATFISAVPVQIQANGAVIAARSSTMSAAVMPQDKTTTPDPTAAGTTATAPGTAPVPVAGQTPAVPAANGAPTTTATTGAVLGAGTNMTIPSTNTSTNPATTGSGPATKPPSIVGSQGEQIKANISEGVKNMTDKIKEKFNDFMALMGGLFSSSSASTVATPATPAAPSTSTNPSNPPATPAKPATPATSSTSAVPVTAGASTSPY
ncbi:hypothetical protein MCOR27_011330 [Pyricularia oryzae]|uniref:Uncharacterized protein n=2 Tax=Pyricularia TaxID=48558 RepID=A0ABQ8NKX1_PYRGI|nr:hypothetical protein MCOR01_004933 [Pyricularia oryzae]KAI6298627.1 hypothetical protein MCOR33_005276 [Pyricularia grisea]KAH9431675.1 hypothetical protein MCOR02_008965 [Pyricularia oryzae]KAI6257995.1 hypothetical protein MCOR19_005582 [Pyricularia oryzae]KAI6265612.1 hypothetical protein MCOR27_011330 [Pyricularia oryzae]